MIEYPSTDTLPLESNEFSYEKKFIKIMKFVMILLLTNLTFIAYYSMVLNLAISIDSFSSNTPSAGENCPPNLFSSFKNFLSIFRVFDTEQVFFYISMIYNHDYVILIVLIFDSILQGLFLFLLSSSFLIKVYHHLFKILSGNNIRQFLMFKRILDNIFFVYYFALFGGFGNYNLAYLFNATFDGVNFCLQNSIPFIMQNQYVILIYAINSFCRYYFAFIIVLSLLCFFNSKNKKHIKNVFKELHHLELFLTSDVYLGFLDKLKQKQEVDYSDEYIHVLSIEEGEVEFEFKKTDISFQMFEMLIDNNYILDHPQKLAKLIFHKYVFNDQTLSLEAFPFSTIIFMFNSLCFFLAMASGIILWLITIYYNTSTLMQYFLIVLSGAPLICLWIYSYKKAKKFYKNLNKVHPISKDKNGYQPPGSYNSQDIESQSMLDKSLVQENSKGDLMKESEDNSISDKRTITNNSLNDKSSFNESKDNNDKKKDIEKSPNKNSDENLKNSGIDETENWEDEQKEQEFPDIIEEIERQRRESLIQE